MIRAAPTAVLAALLLAGAAGAAPPTYRCGLTQAPPGGAIAGPLVLRLDPDRGTAQVADPLTRFYAGGPVAARLARAGQGWRLSWRLDGVQRAGAAPRVLHYDARLRDGALAITARAGRAGTTYRARGQCWPQPAP
ncbi:hypothetical protein U879_12255 [Defluviimonas sp. 20V17]|uniref:Uncharacterized protein n=1 Tax=Allgaiera indica TaxID=765699 RepID=A0AAN4UPP4_9RHOB|nr:hypothetical protein [Allgaiera indica]KDB03455.1 hypothetical protein U879_12255 [Defluviimonas sp. 20V17]GHE00361.1 hypothetical protein GCM10008024_11560 [Allgaiera indica]SDW63088.1 hypothetical protein SAMN05444006_105157 [Allgaiera indica]